MCAYSNIWILFFTTISGSRTNKQFTSMCSKCSVFYEKKKFEDFSQTISVLIASEVTFAREMFVKFRKDKRHIA